jgi:hypothetical protein
MFSSVGSNKTLVGKPEGKGPSVINRHRQGNKIKLSHKETESEAVNWMHLAQDRVQWRIVFVVMETF